MKVLLRVCWLLLVPVTVASAQLNFGASLPAEPAIPPVCGRLGATAIMPNAYPTLTSEGSVKDPIHLGPALTVAGNSAYGSTSCSAASLHGRTLEECQARYDTAALNALIASSACNTGTDVAVQVSTSGSYNSIVLNPVIFPAHLSLIVDSGVTIYGTTQAAAYSYNEDKDGGSTAGVMTDCGTWTHSDANDCRPLLAFVGTNSGIYGYGIIDGRGSVQVDYNPTLDDSGNPLVTVNKPTTDWTEPYSFYTLKDEEQAAAQAQSTTFNTFTPILVQSLNDNFTLYKITLRNSGLFHVQWAGEIASGGDPNYYPTGTPILGYAPTSPGYGSGTNIADHFMAWGVKIAAPWNRSNTDGLNVTGENATIAYSDLSDGDDQVAIGAYGTPSANYQIRYINGYAKNGLSTANSTQWGINHLDFEYANLTGAIPQYIPGSSVNGKSLAYLGTFNSSILQEDALPTILGHVNGLELKNHDSRAAKFLDGTVSSNRGGLISSVYYNNVCLQDLNKPIDRNATYDVGGGTYPAYIQDVTYRYVRVLPPSNQTVNGPTITMPSGSVTNQTYTLNWTGYTPVTGDATGRDYFTLDAVSFDDSNDPNPGGGLYSAFAINAKNNQQIGGTGLGIDLVNSYYPSVLADMYMTYNNNGNVFSNNTENQNNTNVRTLNNVCNATANSNFPFLNGETFYSDSTIGGNDDHPSISTTSSDAAAHLTLQTIIQPSMAQEDLYLRGTPQYFPYGVYEVGAPALNSSTAVTFQVWNSSGTQVSSCTAYHTNNRRFGCAYSALSPSLAPGTYAVTATYAGDTIYPAFTFGSNMTPSGAPDTAGKYPILLPGSPAQTVFVTPTLTIH